MCSICLKSEISWTLEGDVFYGWLLIDFTSLVFDGDNISLSSLG
jgi:hypothetical protein